MEGGREGGREGGGTESRRDEVMQRRSIQKKRRGRKSRGREGGRDGEIENVWEAADVGEENFIMKMEENILYEGMYTRVIYLYNSWI